MKIGEGVTGWKWKKAEDVAVGDHAWLVLNLPCEVLAVHRETVQASGVSLVRFQIDNQGSVVFVARLSHEFVVVEVKDPL